MSILDRLLPRLRKAVAGYDLLLKALKSALPDALLIAGAAGVSYGAWLAWVPAGYIVGGALAIVAGLQLARNA